MIGHDRGLSGGSVPARGRHPWVSRRATWESLNTLAFLPQTLLLSTQIHLVQFVDTVTDTAGKTNSDRTRPEWYQILRTIKSSRHYTVVYGILTVFSKAALLRCFEILVIKLAEGGGVSQLPALLILPKISKCHGIAKIRVNNSENKSNPFTAAEWSFLSYLLRPPGSQGGS